MIPKVEEALNDVVNYAVAPDFDPTKMKFIVERSQKRIEKLVARKALRGTSFYAALYLLIGAALGAYAVKKLPNTWYIRNMKMIMEAFHAKNRLNIVIREEYYRFDEALEAERALISMMTPEPWQGVWVDMSFEPITDPPAGEGRYVKLHMNVKSNDIDEDKNENENDK